MTSSTCFTEFMRAALRSRGVVGTRLLLLCCVGLVSTGCPRSTIVASEDVSTSNDLTCPDGCPMNTACDPSSLSCVRGDGGLQSQHCGAWVGPDVDAGCSCDEGHTCTANHCFGGYWCDTSASNPDDHPRCGPPPDSCPPDAG